MTSWHLGIVWVTLLTAAFAQAQWAPKQGPLMTRWAADVKPDNAHAEYPRPQMVRGEWQNLNGLWDYAVRPKGEDRPANFDGRILVPFPIESALSGVMQRVDENQRVWYRRTFEVPASWAGKHVLLHFGAVDWEAMVWVNGTQFDPHRGGYDPFTFDITAALKTPGPQEVVVAVWDPTDAGQQPRGKQVRKSEGIWYTSTTGIWQTVWLEPVPEWRIEDPKLTADVDHSRLTVTLDSRRMSRSHAVDVVVLDNGQEVARGSGGPRTEVDIPNAKLWSPDHPFLYEVRITLRWWDDPKRVVDEVTCYCGLRKISLGPDDHGVTRLLLNNKPLFMFGPLDQGFWPDGLYTAPADEALRYDVEVLKKLGCNVARKHVKVEPDRWYYWCDKLGLLVWQDMPSGDKIETAPDHRRTPESATQFELELKNVVNAFGNHPCIVMWVPFNEGWGQYDTARIVDLVRQWDPARLVDAAGGWHELGVGDVHDIHDYPGPSSPKPESHRAAVLGEFGGLGLPLTGHTWQAEKNWGYRSFQTPEELTDAYLNLLGTLRQLIADPGLSAAIYTQTTDVEIEVNGLMTYDRAVIKMNAERVTAANRRLYQHDD
jgi:beta-galactosidase/beta-glucuronidase